MTYLCEKYKGLTIVFTPKKYYRNQYDELNKTEGVRAQFFMGRYVTKDPEMIRLLDHWMARHPGEIEKIDEDKEKLIKERMEEARKKAEEEYNKAIDKAKHEIESDVEGKE